MNQLQREILDMKNWDYFNEPLGMGYDHDKFQYSVEPDDFHRICGECGERIEGDVCVACHNPANCPNYPEDCAVCDRYLDIIIDMREVDND